MHTDQPVVVVIGDSFQLRIQDLPGLLFQQLSRIKIVCIHVFEAMGLDLLDVYLISQRIQLFEITVLKMLHFVFQEGVPLRHLIKL